MIKTTFGGEGGSGEELAEVANEQISAIFGHPPGYYEGLRCIEPKEWSALRDQAAIIMARRVELQYSLARLEYRAIGLVCWAVATVAMFAPYPYRLTAVAVAAIGAFAQWQSTDRRPR